MKHLFVKSFLTGLLFFFFFAFPVFAQSAWVITDFQSNIDIQTDGTVNVGETLQVDFSTLEKHGIYRDIPVVYSDENGEKTYTKINVTSVLQDGEQATYELIDNDNNLRIKIGDPNRTINSLHSYEINYVATGVLRSFDTYDELYWNVTGNDWEADIYKASVTVTVPEEKIEKTACFEGYTGYTNPCSITSQTSKNVIFATTRSLPPTQGLTIVTGFTKGMVPILTVEAPKILPELATLLLSAGAFLLALLGGVGSIFWIWFKRGRDFWFRTPSMLDPNAQPEVKPLGAKVLTTVEFTPPEALRPAELGILMDERADTLDVTATIIDLANRGFLTIKEIDKSWIFGSKDYELQKTTAIQNKLMPYEIMLLDRLFRAGETVYMSELKTKFYTELAAIKTELYRHIVDKKLFIGDPEKIRNTYLTIGIVITFIGIFGTSFGSFLTWLPIKAFLFGALISGLVFIFASRSMSRRSALGHELYQRTKGYRLFISGAEKYRQQFYEKKNMFNEILPYAIVFGLTGKFAEAMKDIGVTPTQPTWYTGTHAFTPVVFAADINSFSNSLSTAIASTPAKSGGFSGGSSGGGFGGGGGGSW